MKTRDKFTLEGTHTHTINLTEPYSVDRVAVTFPVAKSFDLTINRLASGCTNVSEELNQTVTSGASLIWVPSSLEVQSEDQLIFECSINDAAEVVIDYSNPSDK